MAFNFSKFNNFLHILIHQTEVDPETTEPSDKLAPVTLEWCKTIGSDAKVLGDVMDGKDQAVLKAIQARIDKVNKKAESNAKKVQKWSILPRDFSIPGGELGMYTINFFFCLINIRPPIQHAKKLSGKFCITALLCFQALR